MSTTDPAPGWRWRAPDAPVAPVRVVVPGGGALWVDAVDPATVTGVDAPDPAALGGAAQLLGRNWLQAVVAALGPGATSADPGLAPPPLPDAWARVALVQAVQRWSDAPLDDGLLALDEALAWAAAGVPDWAHAVAAAHALRVVELVRELHAGRLPGTAHAAVECAAALVVAALAPDDEDRVALEHAEATMKAATSVDADALAAALTAWSAADPVGALVLGGYADDTEPADRLAGPTAYVDPRAVPPRTVAWSRPDEPAVTVQQQGDRAVVRVRLDDGTDSGTAEARGLVVLAVEERTGRIVEQVAVEPDGEGYVAATLHTGLGAGTVLAVCSADSLATVRTTADGRAAAAAERDLLAAWSAARLAAAAGAPADALAPLVAAADAAVLDGEDPDALDRALARVRALVGAPPGDDDPCAPLLAERLVGLGRPE